MRYVALIYKEPDSAFGVVFPDLPGCFSAGDSMDEASQNAAEALASHVRWLEADGDPVPAARTMDEIVADPALANELEGAMLVGIPLVRNLGATTRINVSLDMGLLKAIDDEARSRGQTRSAFLASAARRELVE